MFSKTFVLISSSLCCCTSQIHNGLSLQISKSLVCCCSSISEVLLQLLLILFLRYINIFTALSMVADQLKIRLGRFICYARNHYCSTILKNYLANLLPLMHIVTVSYQKIYQIFHYLLYHQNIFQLILLFLFDNSAHM